MKEENCGHTDTCIGVNGKFSECNRIGQPHFEENEEKFIHYYPPNNEKE